MTRRERFRQFIAKVSPSADPDLAIEDGLYVEPPVSIAPVISAHLELEPASAHLVVGSIGAGKTTELLVAERKLNEHADIRAAYVDMRSVEEGSLVNAALDVFGHREPAIAKQCFRPDVFGDVDPNLDQLKVGTSMLAKAGRTFVILFDSLDRLADAGTFREVVEHDVPRLRECKIGVVLVGPIRSLQGFGRLEADHFDRVHVQGPIDIENDARGREFLSDVLRRRAAGIDAGPTARTILTEGAIERLVALSGGVLRDLISLAKVATEEAYIAGHDVIDVPSVELAADTFGRSLMAGLKQSEVSTLRRATSSGKFVQMSPEDLALVLTRRVLQYPRPSVRYAVHPTITPLLSQMGA